MSRRHDLYTVFEWYNIRTRHLDIADRTHTILEAFQRAVHTCARTIDFVYVDEAQDNLLIDAMIVRALCKNANGLLWAGDTAQTIFAGSSFTFNTLKAFLYRQEEKEPIGFRAKQRPAFFTLTTNFRSRGGIVECGQTVLDLISEFWPGSVDQIPKEAISSGSRPYFFHNAKGADLDLRRLLSESNNLLEFGAEQAIIVRNGVIRDFLRQHLGDSMIVLTLYDSKGLEFNDVLLFNFFSDSWYSQSDWEVLLGAGNADHHIGISIELKFLYVATTRAKKRLWIIDDSEKATSLQRIWASRDQIVTETNRLDLSQFAVASNANEWERRAREFFQDARYRLAAQAFRMAKLEHDANMANAFDLRIQVETLSPTSPLHVHTLREAAEAFLTIASAEQCKRSQREHYIVSAEFFVRIPDSAKAATAFVHAGEYRRGLLLFRSAGMFDEAIAIVNAHPEHIESALSDGVVQAAKLQFCRTGQASKAVALFGDVEDAVQFTELHGLRGAQMKLLSLSSRHDEAALLALKANQPTEWLKIHAQHLASCDQQGTRYTPALIEALTRQAATLVFKSSQQSLDKSQDLLQIVKIWNDSIGVSETVEVREEVRS
ncbi:hypothetical protein PsYK624_104370 [Phanerochaete sordida]|uniref:DNA helicase n=1 Tax=Phanerochaete sordida TaxID=48140 RepID=A0A9P3GG28_9APHY|nr:hypothetical protein PsYK624_104370 [Phanerochaete sordida]